VIDEIITISNETAFETARKLARARRHSGRHLVGRGDRGGARSRRASRNGGQDHRVIIPSFAERYLSTALFEGI
jgi:cysteine synthase A